MHEVEIACEKSVTTKTFYLDSDWNAVKEIIQWYSPPPAPFFFDLLVFSLNVLFRGLDSAVV